MDRRELLRVGVGGLLGACAARALEPLARAAAGPAPRARQVVLLWMNGGPSHLDTWDPKPGRSTGGPFKAIKTATPGLELSQHMPQLAALSGHLAVVRGMSTREGNHERAQFLLHTGYSPNPTVAYPSLGGWVARELGDWTFDLPAFVSISGPSIGAGFLGVEHSPFVVQNPDKPPRNTAHPRLVNAARFERRRVALETLDATFARDTGDAKIRARQDIFGKAIRLMHSPQLKAFDVSAEPKDVIARYGDSDFGKGCLMARRLVEAGIKFVEVVLDGWDTHQNNFDRTKNQLGKLDPAMAALIHDLDQRKLLASTLIICMGEFGRTPDINANDGRDHYPRAWSLALAGGGIRAGAVHGKTDPDGASVIENAVTVPDLFATFATLLGLDPARSVTTPAGRPISLTLGGKPIRALMG